MWVWSLKRTLSHASMKCENIQFLPISHTCLFQIHLLKISQCFCDSIFTSIQYLALPFPLGLSSCILLCFLMTSTCICLFLVHCWHYQWLWTVQPCGSKSRFPVPTGRKKQRSAIPSADLALILSTWLSLELVVGITSIKKNFIITQPSAKRWKLILHEICSHMVVHVQLYIPRG